MDESKIVLIVLGIIFFVVRKLMKGDKKKKQPVQQRKKRPANKPKQQNIDDIFNDFVKELEQKQTRKVQPVKAVKKAATPLVKKKSALDWQKVETTHIPKKKQLINHDDYHNISHRIDPSHKATSVYETEKEAYSFDLEKIDFRDAVIAKEILDRKYC